MKYILQWKINGTNYYSMKYITSILFIGLFALTNKPLHAQISTSGIDVKAPVAEQTKKGDTLLMTLSNENWQYKLGEPIRYDISWTGDAKDLAAVRYSIGPEKMKAVKSGELVLKNGKGSIAIEGVNSPSFIRGEAKIAVNGKEYVAIATAAVSAEAIQPTVKEPQDFDQFWAAAIKQSKTRGLETKMTPMGNNGSTLVDVFQVEYSFENDGAKKFYGVLCVPKKSGKYPAILRLPGAGWVPLSGDIKTAEEGYITFSVYIHGHPVNKDLAYYKGLQENELKDYQFKGTSDRDSFYYKNVILGCVRAADLIYSLPEFDGENLMAWGSSQGGALSIITTSLEPRIKRSVALCPAMCDYTGYLHGRAGGWPHYFAKPIETEKQKQDMIRTLAYYDVVNFAKRIQVPMYFSWGFNDETTPPTSFYAAYNQVKPTKQLFIIKEGFHRIYPQQVEKTYSWLKSQVKPIK